MSDATTADKLFPPSLPARLHWLSAGGEQTLAIRTKVDLYVKELLVKLPGLFVVCEYCTVSVWIYILSDTNGPMVISTLPGRPTLSSLMQASYCLSVSLAAILCLVTSPHNNSSCVCCCLRHHCALTGLHSSILLHESSEVIRHLTRHSMYSS